MRIEADMIQINVKVDGQDKVLRRIYEIAKLPKDMTFLYKNWAVILREEWNKNFESQSADGQAWAALKYRKPKGFENNPIGVNTGEMKEAVAGKGTGAITDISKQRMEIGTDLPKAGWFHFGTYKQEARKIITLTNGTKTKLMASLRMFIKRIIK